jgi:hypothetical protein
MSSASDDITPSIAALAVDYHRSPFKYRSYVLPPAELPGDVGELLHAACGDGELLAKLSRQTEVTPSQFKAAAEFFIRQAFFARDADYYRVLGLRPTDGIERIKEHHRLLMKLFHPDRSDTAGEWTDALAARVNQAYSVLRKPESRREYDASLRAPHAVAAATVGQPRAMMFHWARMPRPGFGIKKDNLPPSVRRHFPEFVLGGTGVFAVLVVGALYFFQEPPLTGSGAIGGAAISAPANVTGKRIAADTANKIATTARPLETIQDDASHSERATKSVVSPLVSATTDPRRSAAAAQAGNESAITASNAPISIPARPESVSARPAVPKVPAKTPDAPASAPPPVAKTMPPAAPPKTEVARPTTVVVASTAATMSGTISNAPELIPERETAPPPVSTPVHATARSVPDKIGQLEANLRADDVPPPVPARTTEKTTVAIAAPVSAPAPAVSRSAFSDLELDRLIGRFIGSYEQGDIDRFMVLFHEDAKTGERKYNKATTRKEYANLFTSTQTRQMMLQGFRWEKGGETIRGQGRFLARVSSQGDPHVSELTGSIRIEVANVGGNLLIKGLFHSIEATKHVPRGAVASRAGGK